MIYSYLDGRLGNILFLIAAGASHAKKMGVPFKALTTMPNLTDGVTMTEYVKLFQDTILRKVDFIDKFPENTEFYKEPAYYYSYLPQQTNLILRGGFQSEKYFNKELVLSLFEIDPATKAYIQNKYNDVLVKNPVCINVRRGDYLALEYKHPVCRMSFFNKAMSFFPSDTLFLVISDDIEWCKKYFRGSHFFFIDNEPPLVDLYLQSMCSHNIISNSTFSWWGAWLNPNPEKKVIYPDPWFGPFYKKELNTKDLCPEEWIKIPLSSTLALYYHAGVTYWGKVIRRIRKIFHF